MPIFTKASNYGYLSEVWHFAANSDIQAGVINPSVDLKDTYLTTFAILNVMRIFNIGTIHFASSSAVYGDLGEIRLTENMGPLLPISNYGAMKLASEASISASCEFNLQRANIFRFPNVVGIPATHGVIFDFIHKLIRNPSRLEVLGDGNQKKSYLHVSDLLNAMLLIRERNSNKIELVNIGPIDDGVTVKWIAQKVVDRINPKADIIFGSGNKGWIGDVPRFYYSVDRLQSYGWIPRLSSAQAIELAINEIAIQLDG